MIMNVSLMFVWNDYGECEKLKYFYDYRKEDETTIHDKYIVINF